MTQAEGGAVMQGLHASGNGTGHNKTAQRPDRDRSQVASGQGQRCVAGAAVGRFCGTGSRSGTKHSRGCVPSGVMNLDRFCGNSAEVFMGIVRSSESGGGPAASSTRDGTRERLDDTVACAPAVFCSASGAGVVIVLSPER